MKTVLVIAGVLIGAACGWAQTSVPGSVTVPITLDHNRVIIDVYFPMPDGSKVRTRAWVDPGATKISITEALCKKLGLKVGEGERDKRVAELPYQFLIGSLSIDLNGIKEGTALSEESIAPGSSASFKVPATLLRYYDVSVNYTDREFTIGPPGSIHFEGQTLKVAVGAQTGLLQTECTIAGEKHTISLDPGTSVSWISAELTSKWHKEHPQWASMAGAVGPANLWGLPDEPSWRVLRIPKLECGSATLSNAVADPLGKNALDWFQKRAGVATIGLIGADVLLNYSVGLDYSHAAIYLKQLSRYTPPGIDVVGITLKQEEDGKYTVIGIASHDGKPSVHDVLPGDKLLTVDNARVSGGTMGQAWSLLSGSPGDVRTLGIDRDGKLISVKATVYRFLPTVKTIPGTKKH